MKNNLEDLVREYVNAPFVGPGRCRRDVLNEIMDLTTENVEADAYNIACELMEEGWSERAKRGVEIGTQGSLCDGISWIFDHMKKLESVSAPVAGQPEARPTQWMPADIERLQAALEAHELAIVPVEPSMEMKRIGARYTDSYVNRAGACWIEMMANGPGGKEFSEYLALALNGGQVPSPVPADHPMPDDSAAKANFWFDCLHKCAKLLELDDHTPIPSGVVAAVEKLVAAPEALNDIPYSGLEQRFFQGLNTITRRAVLQVLGGHTDALMEQVRTHSDERRLFKHLFKAAPAAAEIKHSAACLGAGGGPSDDDCICGAHQAQLDALHPPTYAKFGYILQAADGHQTWLRGDPATGMGRYGKIIQLYRKEGA